MYKYIKGVTVMSEERLYSASEIAEEYSLWSISDDNILVPNSNLIMLLISIYIHSHNLKVSEYYYINHDGFFQVFSKEFYITIMNEFIKYLEDNNIVMSSDTIYKYKDCEFVYYRAYRKKCQIINFEKFKTKHLNRKEDE